MRRIDTHHHAIPSFYRDLLRKAEIDEAGGGDLPEWSPQASWEAMGELGIATAILSVSTPGTTFMPGPTFGSDWPFAPIAAGKLFATGLETYPGLDADARAAIERTNALALFARLGMAPPANTGSTLDQARHAVSRAVMRGVVRLINTG